MNMFVIVFVVIIIIVCVLYVRKQNRNYDDKKIKINWWVVEDFTGCRGNVHSIFVNEKDPKNIDKIILKEFKNKINYDWKIEKE